MMSELAREPALLVWQDGDLIKDQWIISHTPVMIGRAQDCEVQLDVRWVSRQHACIRMEGEKYWLEDAGSKNGVFVNGQRVTSPHILEDGDRIQVAPGLDLIFVDSEATAPLPARADRGMTLDREERRVVVAGRELVPPLSTAQYDFLSILAGNLAEFIAEVRSSLPFGLTWSRRESAMMQSMRWYDACAIVWPRRTRTASTSSLCGVMGSV
jgi:hypothetical protein